GGPRGGAGQLKAARRCAWSRTPTTEVNSLLDERAHRKVLLLAALEELLDAHPGEQAQVTAQGFAQGLGGGVGVGVGPARRLGDDLVDDAQFQEVGGGELERLGGALLLAGVIPQDRRAPCGRAHSVHDDLELSGRVSTDDVETLYRA